MNAQEFIDGNFEEPQRDSAEDWGSAFFPGVKL